MLLDVVNNNIKLLIIIAKLRIFWNNSSKNIIATNIIVKNGDNLLITIIAEW